MAQRRLNPFDHRQVMLRKNFEIFHYNNPASCSCPPHQHDFFELFCLMDDNVDYIVEGLRYTLRRGSIILVGPGQMHRPDVPGPVRDIDRFVLWLSMDYVKALTAAAPRARYTLLGDLTGHNLLQPDPETDPLILQLLFALHREADLESADSDRLCVSIVTQLLIHCGRRIRHMSEADTPKTELRYREIMQVYEYITTHLRENLTVSGLAEQFFMDKNTLTRQFKRQVSMTPGECIRRHRLEAVRKLILDGVPAQEACAEYGFSDYSSFYRAFRQAYGLSPRDYAARQREDAERAPSIP